MKPEEGGVSWKAVVSGLGAVLLLLFAAWMTSMQGQVSAQQTKTDAVGATVGAQAADIAVIKEKLKNIEDRMKEQAERSEKANQKLDELLRKIPEKIK